MFVDPPEDMWLYQAIREEAPREIYFRVRGGGGAWSIEELLQKASRAACSDVYRYIPELPQRAEKMTCTTEILWQTERTA